MFSLYLEELLVYICRDEFDTNDTGTVNLRKSLNNISIRIYLKGQEVPLKSHLKAGTGSPVDYLEMNDSDLNDNISAKLLSSITGNISVRYLSSTNIYQMVVQSSQNQTLVRVLGAMFSGFLVGFLLKYLLPENVVAYISTNIFQTATNMFLNAVKMVVGPMVFCSISYCISSYSDLNVLRNIGKHTLLHYFVNAVIGIILATGLCLLFRSGMGTPSFSIESIDSSVIAEGSSADISNLWEMISGIVPSNIFAAFHSSDIIQIIFFAVIFGIAIGRSGDICKQIRSNINALEIVFKQITNYVMKFLPVMVFCTMAKLSTSIGLDTILSTAFWLLLLFAAYIIMIFIYSLLVWAKTKTNPIAFLKKVFPALMVAFSMGSSSASMSNTMYTCESELNIKPDVYTFSVPLGVSIHSCSSCIFYVISVVFLNNLYTGSNTLDLLNLLFYLSVYMLAFGAPSVSGSGPICVGMLLSSLGAPMELVALIIAWDPVVSTIKTCCSCMEDLSVAYMVNKELGNSSEL